MNRSQAHRPAPPSRLHSALETIAAGLLFVALIVEVLFFCLIVGSSKS